jgi:hypothetical protein
MSLEEIFSECTHEYQMHLNAVKDSLTQLNKDKALILGNHTEENAPDEIKDKIERDKKSWQKEWGIYGSRVKGLIEKHQKQVYDYIRKKDIVNDLSAITGQAKEKPNGRGR